LAGTAAARLQAAEAESVRLSETAAGRAVRLQRLLDEYQASPHTTWTTLYWKQLTPLLSARPLTIVDPRAVARQQWWWIDRSLPAPVWPSAPAHQDRE
jgi:hypothetical protein